MSDPQTPLAEPQWIALSADIRAIDGNHDLGAGALAEALIERGWRRTPSHPLPSEPDLAAIPQPTLEEERQAVLAERLDWEADQEAKAAPSEPDLAALRIDLESLCDEGYQPSYNGRPSCPFCLNFVDSEETHTPDCVLVAALAANPEPVRDGLADAARRYREAVAGGHGMYIDRAVRELQAAALAPDRDAPREPA